MMSPAASPRQEGTPLNPALTSPSLYSFFVFNSQFAGKREDEDYLKILYYYPQNVTMDAQCNSVGLAEALTMFATEFSPEGEAEDSACESLLGEHRRHVFQQVEPGYWMVMVVNMHQHSYMRHLTQQEQYEEDQRKRQEHLSAQKQKQQQSGGTSSTKDQTSLYDSDEIVTYEDYDVSFRVFKSVLRTAYDTFRLFNGSMQHTVDVDGVDVLRARLSIFFTQYIEKSIRHVPDTMALDVGIFDILDGIDFLPVEQSIFLKVQSFINHCKDRFSTIHGAIFYFDKYLIFSGMSHDETRLITKYVPSLLSDRLKELENRLRQRGRNGNGSSSGDSQSGRFLTGPEDLDSKDTRFSAPHVFLGPDEKEHCLIVYQHQRINVFFIVDSESLVKKQFYLELQSVISSRLHIMMKLISDSIQQINNFNDIFRYMYYNHMNLAIKSSIKKTNVSQDALNTIMQMHSAFETSRDGLKEMYIRTKKDNWVVGKYSGKREFYIVFDQKSYSLFEVNDQVAFVSSLLFGGGGASGGGGGSSSGAIDSKT